MALARDADTLYLAYRVDDDTPLVNLGENWQTLFISGDCVDLMLAANPKANPTVGSPRPGTSGCCSACSTTSRSQCAIPASGTGGKEPGHAHGRAARRDREAVLGQSRRASRRPVLHRGGRGPVQGAGAGSKTGEGAARRCRVIYSDETGHNRSLRLYYYNRKTKMIADLTTEATLQPAEWGTIRSAAGTQPPEERIL